MSDNLPQSTSLYLNDEKRKKVDPSPLAAKAIAKAPPNLAIYDKKTGELHDVVKHVLDIVQKSKSSYETQYNAMKEKWEKADSFYWMAQKEWRMPELTRAKVSASVFHRVVRRLADGAYLASVTEDMPVKFEADIGIFEPSDQKQRKAVVCEALNRWALYCMKKTDIKAKSSNSFHSVYKYSDHIAYVPYDYQIEKRKRWVPKNPNELSTGSDGVISFVHNETGEIKSEPHQIEMVEEEYDYVCKDHVGFYPIPIENCYLDDRITSLDRQTCFIWRSDMTRPEIWSEAKAGKFQNIEKITDLQKYDVLGTDSEVETSRKADAGKATVGSETSEMYERWQSWILLPKIKVTKNTDGEVTNLEWDQNGESRRYLMESFGALGNTSVVVRLSESPYWSNGIPFIDAHSHEDDDGFYHRGLVELLEDNMLQEHVTKGQLMDNRALLNFRPMVRLHGRVRTKDMHIGPNKVFDVSSLDALTQLQISDLTGNISHTLDYLSKDSEQLAQTPPFLLGESMGARTSATEFASIRDQSSAPALNDIKKLCLQIFGGYLRKLKEYAPQFLDKDIAVQVAGPQGEEALLMVTADEFDADFAVKEMSVQEFENKATMRQILLSLVSVVGNPLFAPFINTGGFLMRVFKTFSSVFPNPEEIMNKDPQTQAIIQSYLTQKPPQPVQNEAPAMEGQPVLTTGQMEAMPQAGAMGAVGGA